jgi:hypothetical protein
MHAYLHSHPAAPTLIFPLFFVAFGCMVPLLICRLSGWATLARRFRATIPFTGQTLSWKSARMRWGAGYNNCLTIGADPAGLSLSMAFLFRLGHPPLFLPWHEVSIRRRFKLLFGKFVEFRLGGEEQIPFAIDAKLAERLQSAAGINWPAEPKS